MYLPTYSQHMIMRKDPTYEMQFFSNCFFFVLMQLSHIVVYELAS